RAQLDDVLLDVAAGRGQRVESRLKILGVDIEALVVHPDGVQVLQGRFTLTGRVDPGRLHARRLVREVKSSGGVRGGVPRRWPGRGSRNTQLESLPEPRSRPKHIRRARRPARRQRPDGPRWPWPWSRAAGT